MVGMQSLVRFMVHTILNNARVGVQVEVRWLLISVLLGLHLGQRYDITKKTIGLLNLDTRPPSFFLWPENAVLTFQSRPLVAL